MEIFLVMAYNLIAVGALVGGVVGILVPKISTASSLGFFVALFVCGVSLFVFRFKFVKLSKRCFQSRLFEI